MSQLTTYEVKGTKETAGSRNGKMTGRDIAERGKRPGILEEKSKK